MVRIIVLILIVGTSTSVYARSRIPLTAPSELPEFEGVTLGMTKSSSLARYKLKLRSSEMLHASDDEVFFEMPFNGHVAVYNFSYVDDKLKNIQVTICMWGKTDKEKLSIFNLDAKYLQSKYGKPTKINTNNMAIGWIYEIGFIVYRWHAATNRFWLVFEGYDATYQ